MSQFALLQPKNSVAMDHVPFMGSYQDSDQKSLNIQRSLGQSRPQSAEIPPVVHDVLASPGQPLDLSMRQNMERSFGRDFSDVRVHADGKAAASALPLGAKAYTVGSHIVFGRDHFAPSSSEGRRLLAHELTHVVQQNRSDLTSPVFASTEAEHVAESVAAQIAVGHGVSAIPGRTIPGLAMDEDKKLRPLPALSHDELMKFLLNQRGFGTSKPGPLVIDPKGVGTPTGKGYQTYAAVQIVDKKGNQVSISFGAYLGGGDAHGEQQAIAFIQKDMARNKLDIRGGKMIVAVEQVPCSGCGSVLQDFAKKNGLDSYEVYVPDRESLTNPGKSVKPKTAATTAFQGKRGPTTAKLHISVKLGGGGAPTSALPSGGGKAASVPTGKSLARQSPSTAIAPSIASSKKPSLPASKGSSSVSSALKAEARSASKAISSELKLLRAAKVLMVGTQILSGVASLATLAKFMNMAQSGLSGQGFLHTKQIAQAESLRDQSDKMKTEYEKFSASLGDLWLSLVMAGQDPLTAGEAASALADLRDQPNFTELVDELPGRIVKLKSAFKEVSGKRKAIEKILSDPASVGGISAVFMGTAELAELFAVSQDFSRIESALSQSLTSLKKLNDMVKSDQEFLENWYNTLFKVCLKGGVCSETVIDIPFVGTSRVHGLPGSAEE